MLAETQRTAMLQTMGVDVYRLRGAGRERSDASSNASAADVIVICPRVARAGLTRFGAQLPLALGIASGHIHWCDAEDAAALPAAPAYVAIGTQAARTLGIQLSTMQQNSAVLATTAEPAGLLHDSAAKRALWQALKPVTRCLREFAR